MQVSCGNSRLSGCHVANTANQGPLDAIDHGIPPAPAGSYGEGETTGYPRPRDVEEREEVSIHYFTGVDIALVDFPGQDDEGRDEYGNIVGQVQRRQQLLESAATVSVSAPGTVSRGGTASITVDVKNVGAGHNIPSGFSQERQM